MTRRRKLLTAGGIVVLGMVLAWPFRRTAGDVDPAVDPMHIPADAPRASNGDPIANLQPAANVPTAPAQVAAQMASTNPSGETSKPSDGLESFDIANHPALTEDKAASVGEQSSPPTSSPAATQPAYNTGDLAPKTAADGWPAELIHVVANGDTLERLAQRYLNDPGRALDIFDLNRDQLSNPHLLPIGVELRVPQNPDRIID